MSTHNPTPSEAAAKREGYIAGRHDENYVQRVFRRRVRAADSIQIRESSSTGMIFGMVIAGLAMAIGGLFYVASMDRSDVAPIALPATEGNEVPAAPAVE